MKKLIKSTVLAAALIVGGATSNIATAAGISDPDLVRQAQELLYNLNYDVGEINGQMTEETKAAILKYQQNTDREQTGELTVEILLALKDATPPSRWGALSAALDGGWGAAWNYGSRGEAEEEALKHCRKNSDQKCDVLAIHTDACIAAYHWSTDERWGWRMRTGASVDKAKLNALQDCHKYREGEAECNLMAAICADGRHSN